jgi:hypothetical protein
MSKEFFSISGVVYEYHLLVNKINQDRKEKTKDGRKGKLTIIENWGFDRYDGIIFLPDNQEFKNQTKAVLIKENSEDGTVTKSHEGGLIKNDYIRIDKSFNGRFDIAAFFHCKNNNDLMSFIQAWIDFDQIYRIREQLLLELQNDLLKRCKTQAKVNFIDLVDYHKILFEKYINKTQDDRWRSPIETVQELCRRRIEEGKLTGIIDTEKHIYYDPRFVVQEQRVININVQMDFNNLVQQLGNKGIVLNAIQCPKCGSPHAVPKDGTTFTCGSCGCIIDATDVFQKFKSFLFN